MAVLLSTFSDTVEPRYSEHRYSEAYIKFGLPCIISLLAMLYFTVKIKLKTQVLRHYRSKQRLRTNDSAKCVSNLASFMCHVPAWQAANG